MKGGVRHQASGVRHKAYPLPPKGDLIQQLADNKETKFLQEYPHTGEN